MIGSLFKSIDEKDPEAFSRFLAEDCRFKFGNMPEVVGRSNVEAFVRGFFESIDSLSHDVKESWDVGNGMVCHGSVTYTRKSGSKLTVPFSNILKMRDGQVYEYLIFADVSELYE